MNKIIKNYRGKKVKVSFYEYFESKPYKTVIGKVKSIYTSYNVMDKSKITIEDKKGKLHHGGYGENFKIIKAYE